MEFKEFLTNPKRKSETEESGTHSKFAKVDDFITASQIWDESESNRQIDVDSIVDHLNDVSENSSKKLLRSFYKCLKNNSEMRSKYSENPEKFLSSEMELHESLQGLFQISSDNVSVFLEDDIFLQEFATVLMHENSDIQCTAMLLLQEITDEDVSVEDKQENFKHEFVTKLLKLGFPKLISLHISDRNSESDTKSLVTSFSVIENFISIEEESVQYFVEEKNLLSLLLSKIQEKDSLYVSLFSAELLASILAISLTSHKYLLEIKAIDILLNSLAAFRKRDPRDEEEQEYMANSFDCLCSLIGSEAGKKSFLESEGVELMILMLSSKFISKIKSLRVLSHLVSGGQNNLSQEICKRIVDLQGLKYIFPSFVKKHLQYMKKSYGKSFDEDEEEEHVCNLIYALMNSLDDQEPEYRLTRLFKKFEEEKKINTLVQLHIKYKDKVNKLLEQERIDLALLERANLWKEIQEYKEISYVKMLDGGLYLLQKVDLIILELLQGENSSPETKTLLSRCLQENSVFKPEISTVIEDYILKSDLEEKSKILLLMQRYDPHFLNDWSNADAT